LAAAGDMKFAVVHDGVMANQCGVPVWVPAPRLIYAESFEILEFNMKTWAIPK
jgi:hypothetical protein